MQSLSIELWTSDTINSNIYARKESSQPIKSMAYMQQLAGLCSTNVTTLYSCSLTLIIWTVTEWISVASPFHLVFHTCMPLPNTYHYRSNTKYLSASAKSLATYFTPVLIA